MYNYKNNTVQIVRNNAIQIHACFNLDFNSYYTGR